MAQSKSNKKVLFVDDSDVMQALVQSVIGSICDLNFASNLKDAYSTLLIEDYSLLLLDVILPDGDGFDFCQRLRQNSIFMSLPIIFLTGKNEIIDRVRGFDIGADDYVVKPIEPNEFKARVMSKLNRGHYSKDSSVFTKASFKINMISQKAYVSDLDLGLTPIEFKIFSLLFKNEGQVYSRSDLKKYVWGPSIHLTDHTIDTHISSLRKKMAHFSSCLKSVVKTGYVFNLEDVRKKSIL